MQPYAVVNPGAVVVKAFHTPIADRAVARPVSPYYFTVGTEQDRVEVLQHLHESDCLWFFHVTRISTHSYRVK